MPNPKDGSAKAPKGTRPVAQAFIDALDAIPASSSNAVAKAALAKIKTHLADRRAAAKIAKDKISAATKAAGTKARPSGAKVRAITTRSATKRPYTRRAKPLVIENGAGAGELGALN